MLRSSLGFLQQIITTTMRTTSSLSLYQLLILLPCVINSLDSECPDWCTCYEVTKSVICSSIHLTGIPNNIPLGTEHLVLDNNYIREVRKDDFTGLSNLQSLHLHNNIIGVIEDYSFQELGNLTELSLNRNYLKKITANTFHGLKKMEILWITQFHSPGILPCIEDYAFATMPNLKSLEMANNDLLYVTSSLFSGLDNLTNLSLTLNRISKVSKDAFKGFSNTIFVNLGPENVGVCCCSTAGAIASLGNHSKTICEQSICYDNNIICKSNYTSTCHIQKVWSSAIVIESSFSSSRHDENFYSTPFVSFDLVVVRDTTSVTQSVPKRSIMASHNSKATVTTTIATTTQMVATLTTQEVEPRPPQEARKYGICPEECTCYHSSKAVVCSQRYLRAIPKEISADTKTLILDDNKIEKIRKYDLYDLNELETLHLHNNRISKIDDESFKDLQNLTSLFLQSNLMSKITRKTFIGLVNLNVLWMSNIHAAGVILHIDNGAFQPLEKLTALHLNGNDFLCLSSQFFTGLNELKSLALSIHRIGVLSAGVFRKLPTDLVIQTDTYDVEVCCCSTASALEEGNFQNLQTICNKLTCNDTLDSICLTCSYETNVADTAVSHTTNIQFLMSPTYWIQLSYQKQASPSTAEMKFLQPSSAITIIPRRNRTEFQIYQSTDAFITTTSIIKEKVSLATSGVFSTVSVNDTSAVLLVTVNSSQQQIEWGKDPNNALKQHGIDFILITIMLIFYCILF